MTLNNPIVVTVGMGVIKFFVYTYEYITMPLYYIFKRSMDFIALPNSPAENVETYKPDEGRILAMSTREGEPAAHWRCVEAMDKLSLTPYPGCETMTDIWLRSVALYNVHSAVGTREVLSTDYETASNGKQFIKLTLGRYTWESYTEVEERVSALAAGIHDILGPVTEDPQSRKPCAIYSETRAEWIIAALACFRLNRPLVTLYATLGEEALITGFTQSESILVFTSDELAGKIVPLATQCPKMKHIVYFNNGVFVKHPTERMKASEITDESHLSDTAQKSVEKAFKLIDAEQRSGRDLQFYSIIDVEKRGTTDMGPAPTGGYARDAKWMPPTVEIPKSSDLAIIMYTSGSTGVPKGVEMTHSNLVSALSGFMTRLPKPRPLRDTYIGYLPLAHVLELCCEFTMLNCGVRVGYSNPQTLTDTSTRIKSNACRGDLIELRPTHFATVPTVLERISKAVWEKVSEGGLFSHSLFRFAYDYKLRRLHNGFPSLIVDRLVFRKVRSLIGGRVRYILCGGAPLAEDSQLFVNVCFAPIIQGYGLTETCSSATIMECGDLRCNQVGAPVSSVEIRLRSWPEGGYSPYDKEGPRGEILVCGGPISRGYFKQPELTARDFFHDPGTGLRYFCTGDIGHLHPDGCLSIIDRKKDLVKLQAGEYVSLGKVEVALRHSVYVENVCVYVDPRQSYAVCFVSPKRKQLKQLAVELKLQDVIDAAAAEAAKYDADDAEARGRAEHVVICNSEKVTKAVQDDLKKVAIEKRLATFEIPQRIYLDADAWTPDTGLVTDALKLRRINLQQRFVNEIDTMYNKPQRT